MPLIPTREKAAYMTNCYMRQHQILLQKRANKIAKMSEERNYFVTLQRKDRLPWGDGLFCKTSEILKCCF